MTRAGARAEARRLFDIGVAAADPERSVTAALADAPPPSLILALGKAACPMARAALKRFPGCPAIVVTTEGAAQAVEGAKILIGSHPVPDARSDRAGRTLLTAAEATSGLVLVLVSGGASALAATPVPGLTIDDLGQTVRGLLASGLDIAAMNRVRQALSAVAGGGIARACAGNALALVLSDVVGDDPAIVASGPCARPMGPPADAARLLKLADLWTSVPETARDLLIAEETVPTPDVPHRLIGGNGLSLAALTAASATATADPVPLEGDVAEAAARILATAKSASSGQILCWGGETTVRLTGEGRGGRNQELSLRVACGMQRPFVFLSGGTDGRDGPTDAAGGLVDDGTLGRIAAAGLDIAAVLNNNDSYPALASANDLLMTGETGTNVADLQIMVLLP